MQLRSGIAGAVTVTALHQLTRLATPYAPRMDTLGRRGLKKLGVPVRGERLQWLTLAADLVSNAFYYAFVGPSFTRGALLGAAAGAGAVELPPRLGLGRWPSRRTKTTRQLAFALYFTAGLAAAFFARRRE